MSKNIKIALSIFLLVISGENIFGQLGPFLKRSAAYYHYSGNDVYNEEKIIIFNHNQDRTYISLLQYNGYLYHTNGHWKENGDTLTLYPSICINNLDKSNQWKIEDKDRYLLKPFSLLKLKTGELIQLPWPDEDDFINQIYGRYWEGLTRLYLPYIINLNINAPKHGAGYLLGPTIKQATAYYSWSWSYDKECYDEEKMIFVNHNKSHSYESILAFHGNFHCINGNWKENGDTLTFYPNIYLEYDNDEWIIDNEVSDSRLRQFSFLKQDTGELIPLHDEDDYSNQTDGEEWGVLKRLYCTDIINLNIDMPARKQKVIQEIGPE